MTDLKDFLETAAGPVPAVTDDDVAADLGRARKAARRRRFAQAGMTAGVAAITVAALAVPLAMAPGGEPDVASPSITSPDGAGVDRTPARTMTAGQLLLVAAAAEERTPATTGRYFLVRSVSSRDYVIRGPETYKVRQDKLTETWTGRKGGTAWVGERSISVKPATPADAAAWERAGSPSTWNLGPTDTADGHDLILSAKGGPGTLREAKQDADRYHALGTDAVPLAEILALPRTVEGLRSRLLRDKAARAAAADTTSYLAEMAAGLISSTPARPEVRGAALRLLAGLPGAEVTERVTDPIGRRGTAVRFSFSQYQLGLELIIDPATGKLLTSRRSGGKNGDTSVLSIGWTNDRPVAPTTNGG
ncbi:hypothetical protein FB561_0894 [Kribbella amoyensis]|uniref:CU044_5270 family protein n=1 Tax=Kribbella amoyensis TaxID=996641 RepID=A0A561BLV8_9ACTN|nr:CU044_5270 family protein [Kribbella amoyensis]TWD79828.1 hypothetical protein FB561_0894 [Kribbella amoyensis]